MKAVRRWTIVTLSFFLLVLVTENYADQKGKKIKTEKGYCQLVFNGEQDENQAGSSNAVQNDGLIMNETQIKEFTRKIPLILSGNSREKKFIYPSEDGKERFLSVKQGDSIRIACPGSKFRFFYNQSITSTDAYLDCGRFNKFKFRSTSLETKALHEICCENPPISIAIKTDKPCGNKSRTISKIGFNLGTSDSMSDFYPIIDVCVKKPGQPVYAHAIISKYIKKFGMSCKAGGKFSSEKFCRDEPVADAYQPINQEKHFNAKLGEDRVSQYFPNITSSGQFYFARGHLIARTDFIYPGQMLATSHLLNCVPMWQTINGGNWQKMEQAVRELAHHIKADLEVWAGGLKQLELEDTDNVSQKIDLFDLERIEKKIEASSSQIKSKNQRFRANVTIVVPKILFKVVKHGEAGIVFLTANNPYLKELGDYEICKNICREADVNWYFTSKKQGLSYCCRVRDFIRATNLLPQLEEVYRLLHFTGIKQKSNTKK